MYIFIFIHVSIFKYMYTYIYMYIYMYSHIHLQPTMHFNARATCRVLQHTATHCNTLQFQTEMPHAIHTATHCNTMQHTVTPGSDAARCEVKKSSMTARISLSGIKCLSVWQSAFSAMPSKINHTATHCNTLEDTARHYNTLQHTSRHCKTLQHTATQFNTP